jgi:Tfp pilus assembly protein PilF
VAVLFLAALVGTAVGVQHWYQERSLRDRREAEAALRVFDLNRAAEALGRHLERHPDDGEAWFLAARTARRLGHIPEAETYLLRYEGLGGDPENARLERDLIQVQRGNLGEVDRRLRDTIGPDHPDALFVLEALARGYLRREQLADCLQACDLWIARQPEHPWPWLFRGVAFEKQGHLDEARADYLRAVELAPDDRASRIALGRLLLVQRRAPDAEPHFRHVLAHYSDDVAALVGAARCMVEMGRGAEAPPLLDRAADLAPPSTEAIVLRAKIAVDGHKYIQAESLLRIVIQQVPEDREARHLLAQVLLAQGKTEEAESVRERGKSIERDVLRLMELIQTMARAPNDPKPRYEAGVIAIRLGRADQGRYWLEEALRVRPGYAPALAALAEEGQERDGAAPAKEGH